MNPKISEFDLNNIDNFALEITKNYLNNIHLKAIDYEVEDYTKMFIIYYQRFYEALNNLKSSNLTFDELSKEFYEKYNKETN